MRTFVLLLLAVASLHCTRTAKSPVENLAQTGAVQIVGGGCDGCELIYVGMPMKINAVDTSAGWNEKGRKLIVNGTVYKSDGKTPAADIVLYYWQTNNDGLYSASLEMDQKAKRHGHIRGWVKTDKDGRYALYTVRPAAYPNTENPEHIHVVVKEPALNEYYIDEFVFDDDRWLTADNRKRHENRGGSGILKTVVLDDIETASHNIVLGKNIPNYPTVP